MNVLSPMHTKTAWGVFVMGLLHCPGGRPALFETREEARDSARMMRSRSVLRPRVKRCRLRVEVLEGGDRD